LSVDEWRHGRQSRVAVSAVVGASYRGVYVETRAESWVNCGEWDVETREIRGGWRQVAPLHRLLVKCVAL